jgi:serine/threonine protein kinase
MSPEQASGTVRLISARSDVFSLGAILRFLLTLEQAKATNGEKRGAGPGSESAPKALRAICHKAMAIEPAERYDSARSLAVEVQRFLAGVRVEAHPETPWDTILRLARKYRTPLLLILAYLVMRILLLFWKRV